MRVGQAHLAMWMAASGLLACGTTPNQRLQGKWVGERVENFTAAQAARAAGWIAGASFEFSGSRVTVSIPAESPRQGTYKLEVANGDELLVSFLRPHGAKDQVALRFEGNKRLRWNLQDGRSIVLRKVDD